MTDPWGQPQQQPWHQQNQPWPPPQQQGYTGPGAPPPPPEGGQGIKPSEHLHDLVWVKVKRYDPDFVGQYGAKPAIIIDCEILQGRFDVGKRFVDSLHTNYLLVGQFQGHVGAEFFGHFEEQVGTQGAIYLASPRAEDAPVIQQFLARRQAQPAPAQAQGSQPQQQPQAQPFDPAGYRYQQQNGQPPAQQMPPAQAPPVQEAPPF